MQAQTRMKSTCDSFGGLGDAHVACWHGCILLRACLTGMRLRVCVYACVRACVRACVSSCLHHHVGNVTIHNAIDVLWVDFALTQRNGSLFLSAAAAHQLAARTPEHVSSEPSSLIRSKPALHPLHCCVATSSCFQHRRGQLHAAEGKMFRISCRVFILSLTSPIP